MCLGTVAVYNPFKLFRLLSGCYGRVRTLQWSPDSKLIIVGCEDATCKIFAAEWIKGFYAYSLGSHKSSVVGCFFSNAKSADCFTVSRDGAVHSWLCSKSIDEFKLYERGSHLYANDDVEDEKELTNSSSQQAQYPQMNVKFSIGSRFHVATRSPEINVTSCDYHSHTKLMVFGLSDGTFSLYEVGATEFVQIQSLSIESGHPISAICFNPSGDWIGIGSEQLGQLLVWEWQSECYIVKQQSHAHASGGGGHVVTAASFSPDELLVVTGGNDSKVKVWQSKSGLCLVTFAEHTATITAVIVSQSGKMVISASLDGTVRAFDLKRYRNFKTLTSPRPAQFTGLAVDDSADIVAACAIDLFEVYVWSMKTGTILEVLTGHTSTVICLEFAPITCNLVTASLDGYLRLWNASSSSTPFKTCESLHIGHEIMGLAISPNGAEAVISTSKANLQLIDILSCQVRDMVDCRHDLDIGRGVDDQTTAKSRALSKTFTSLSYSPDGSYLLAGGNSNSLCLYCIPQFILVRKFQISQNLSIDRMHEMLDRRKMTEFGNKDLVDSGVLDAGGKKEGLIPLPGVKTVDLSQRLLKGEMRVDHVQFSPSGRSWLAACTEGCVLYSLDTETLFDPYQLTEEISPQTIERLLEERTFQLALIYSLKLGNHALQQRAVEQTPSTQIESIVSNMPTIYIFHLVRFLTTKITVTHSIDLYLIWCKSILLFHRSALKELMERSDLLAFGKALVTRYDQVRAICEPVSSSVNYFLTVIKLASFKLSQQRHDRKDELMNIDDVMQDLTDSESDDEDVCLQMNS